MNTEGNTFLRDLSGEVQYNVTHKLNRGNACKLVADYFNIGDDYGISEGSSNGEALFYELCDQNYTVAYLCEALEKCDLLHILALFQEPVPLQIKARPLVLCEAKSSHNGICNEISIAEGNELKLKAEAEGIPPPKYEWHCDNSLICSNSSGLLTIEKIEKKHEGNYWCKISQEQENSRISEATEDVVVTVGRIIDKDRPKVSAKKALLMANQNYDFDRLLAPASDTAMLHDVLKEMYNFDVTVKEDLTGVDMKRALREFWKDVPDNSYVIFYFAGHGFHINNDLFFMGIDRVKPKDFGFEHAMSHEEVVQEGSEHSPSLLLMLCDTCQSQLQDDEYVAINRQTPPKYNYLPYPDVIQGYATSRNGEAFEVADKGASRGLFTKHLIKALTAHTHLCVSEILAIVRKGVNKEAHKYGDLNLQVPMEVTSAIRTHRLSDPISKRKKKKVRVESTKETTDD